MAEFKLPELGENIEKAEVLKVLVAEGDTVEKDQPVLELETDKATFEVPSPHAGTVGKVHVKEGDTVKVGQAVLTLDEGRPEKRKEPKDKEPARREEPEEPAAREEPAEEEPAEQPEPPREAGQEKEREEPQPPPERDRAQEAPRTEVAAGPATRRLARELGVDLAQVRGSEAGGRIGAEDVKRFVRERREAPARADEAGFERWGEVERRRLSGLERAAARNLAAAWREIPHVTHHDHADVTSLEAARRRFVERRGDGPKLTMTALVVKAAVAALQTFPRFNSSLDPSGEELVLKRYVHVGIAVDTEAGLLVPVLRDADRKTTLEIAAEVESLAERARERKLAPEDMQGAGFTITNLGGIGGVAFTPIVNHPEVAILGVSRARAEPVLRDGQLGSRLVLPLSLSYDHRVVNGADAARFVRFLAGLLEDPLELLARS
jgi:pyruvate dehydrogenase E2 component (dihydrolipoamide acetyltransferase)